MSSRESKFIKGQPLQCGCGKDKEIIPHETTDNRDSPFTNLSALIIGIHEYKQNELMPLPGACADVKAMYTFLRDMNVSAGSIKVLRNESATGPKIRRALLDVADLAKKNEPILIYFSGHGRRATDTTSRGRVICPYDLDECPSVNITEKLHEIASCKGREKTNITLILDCCYAGSGGDGSSSDDIPSSHILLAGSGRNETAMERSGGGAFTNALLNALRARDARQHSYKSLIESLPTIATQSPQCVGVHQGRLLFTCTLRRLDKEFYQVSRQPRESPSGYAYRFPGGNAYGLTKKSTFDIYIGPSVGSEKVGTFRANPITNFACDLVENTIANDPPLIAYAVCTRINRQFGISIPKDRRDIVENSLLGKHKNIPVNADLSEHEAVFFLLKSTDGLVHFEYCYRESKIPLYRSLGGEGETPSSSENIRTVLSGAADFDFHLTRRNDDHPLSARLRCYELKESTNGSWDPEEGSDLIQLVNESDPKEYSPLDLNKYRNKPLGFEVENTCNMALYVALFYFDLGDLSIVPFYEPGSAKDGRVDYSVEAGEKLSIGYGGGGSNAFAFQEREADQVDRGVLKLFLSTQWVDFSVIKQKSPFDGCERIPYIYKPVNSPWGSIEVQVKQGKAPN